ncbi:MAG: hypothetical protein ACR2HJ_05750 [Fimbriimonadales bacterium]
MIRGGNKIVASYSGVNVHSGGLFAGGFLVLVDRTPRARIVGEDGIAFGPGETDASSEYVVLLNDLRRPVSIVWESDGLVVSQNSVTTTIGFSLAEDAKRAEQSRAENKCKSNGCRWPLGGRFAYR